MSGAFDLGEGTAVLRRTPSVLRALLAGLPDAWTRVDDGEGTWSPFDVVGHLIDGEETDWMARLRIVLAGDEARAFEPFDRFRHVERNRGRSLEELLDEFGRLREANLRDLDGLALGAADMERRGTHPAFGSVTLGQLLATWVAHDLTHTAQIARTMARRYKHEVGPWREYLRALQD